MFERASSGDAVDPVTRMELASAQWVPDVAGAPVARTSLARAGIRIAQIATEQLALTDDVARFERDAERHRRWLAELDLAILPDDALTTTLAEVSEFLMRAHGLHRRASAAVLAGHALLASVLAAIEPARAAWLAHAVTSGVDVATSRPGAAFCHVAAIAEFDPAARDMILRDSLGAIAALPEGPLRRALEEFSKAYGDRGAFETELSGPRWGEDPRPLFAMLASFFRAPPVDPEVGLSRARALADRQLAELEPRLSYFETRVVRDIVSRQKDLLRLRERCRVRVAHGFSMMRVVALDVDRRIRRLDPSLDSGSALMLTFSELTVAVAKYPADLAPIVRARRNDYRTQLEWPSPTPVFRGAPRLALPVPQEPTLRGLPTSAGVVEGPVLRLRTSDDLRRSSPTDVLVVESLDSGLVPLLFQAAAVVSDLGTPFSSSAVVARDCGIPAVTGVAGAALLLRDGERVRVNGDAGTVDRLTP
jgi:pyruvate,water dikinase